MWESREVPGLRPLRYILGSWWWRPAVPEDSAPLRARLELDELIAWGIGGRGQEMKKL